jgi:hypothetical protein
MLCVGLFKLGLNLTKKGLLDIGGCTVLLYPKPGQLHTNAGPDRWPQGGRRPITASKALVASSRQMMISAAWSVPGHVAQPHCT